MTASPARASSEHAVEFTRLDQYPPFRTLVSEPRYEEIMRTPNVAN